MGSSSLYGMFGAPVRARHSMNVRASCVRDVSSIPVRHIVR